MTLRSELDWLTQESAQHCPALSQSSSSTSKEHHLLDGKACVDPPLPALMRAIVKQILVSRAPSAVFAWHLTTELGRHLRLRSHFLISHFAIAALTFLHAMLHYCKCYAT